MDDPPTITPEQWARQHDRHLEDLAKLTADTLPFGSERCRCRAVVMNGRRYGSTVEAADATGFPERVIRERCNGIVRGPRAKRWNFRARFAVQK